MKHGPIALLEEGTPGRRRRDPHGHRVRQGRLEHPGDPGPRRARDRDRDRGNEDIQHHANDVIYVPKSPAFLQAVLATLPLQLLAYRIARLRGLNVDQPRNLAKTVTVE